MTAPEKHIIRVPNHLTGDGRHEIVCYDWGNAMANQTVVCVHGLTRNAHDFDMLAAELAKRGRRVLAISMAGRGESAWLKDPVDYSYPSYVADCLKVLDNFHLRQVEWVGTSMGGIIGMLIASEHPGRIQKMVLNDVGVRLKKDALLRIYEYVRNIPPSFPDRATAEIYLRHAFKPYNIAHLPIWEQFVENSLLPQGDGSFKLACDPAIIEPIRRDTQDFTEIEDVNLSAIWQKILIPTLIIRGEESDILDAETTSAMRSTNPKSSSITIKGVGHAPSLMVPEQVKLVADYLTVPGAKLMGI